MLRKREKLVLCQILDDSRKSDRQIARDIGATQSTVTRIRRKLESDGYVVGYHAIANMRMTGLSVIITTYFEWIDFTKKDALEEIKKYILTSPYLAFFGRGEGLSGKTMMVTTVHKTFDEYDDFMRILREKWNNYIRSIDYFVVSVDSVYRLSTKDSVVHSLMSDEKQDKPASTKAYGGWNGIIPR